MTLLESPAVGSLTSLGGVAGYVASQDGGDVNGWLSGQGIDPTSAGPITDSTLPASAAAQVKSSLGSDGSASLDLSADATGVNVGYAVGDAQGSAAMTVGLSKLAPVSGSENLQLPLTTAQRLQWWNGMVWTADVTASGTPVGTITFTWGPTGVTSKSNVTNASFASTVDQMATSMTSSLNGNQTSMLQLSSLLASMGTMSSDSTSAVPYSFAYDVGSALAPGGSVTVKPADVVSGSWLNGLNADQTGSGALSSIPVSSLLSSDVVKALPSLKGFDSLQGASTMADVTTNMLNQLGSDGKLDQVVGNAMFAQTDAQLASVAASMNGMLAFEPLTDTAKQVLVTNVHALVPTLLSGGWAKQVADSTSGSVELKSTLDPGSVVNLVPTGVMVAASAPAAPTAPEAAPSTEAAAAEPTNAATPDDQSGAEAAVPPDASTPDQSGAAATAPSDATTPDQSGADAAVPPDTATSDQSSTGADQQTDTATSEQTGATSVEPTNPSVPESSADATPPAVSAVPAPTQQGATSADTTASNLSAAFSVTPASGAAYVVADGKDSWTAKLVVTDNGQSAQLPNPALLTLTPSSPSVTVSAITDSHNGTYTATVTAQTAGSYTLTAAYGAQALASQPIAFVASGPDPAQSQLTVSPSSLTVACGGQANVTIQAVIKDSQGTVLPGVSVVIEPEGSDPLTATTNESGVAQANIALTMNSDKTWNPVFHASVSVGGAQTEISGSPATVQVNPSGVCYTSTLALTPSSATVPADGQGSYKAVLTVKSANGDLKSGDPDGVVFQIYAADGKTPSGAVKVGPVTDTGNGTYTANLTSTLPGTYVVSGSWYTYTSPAQPITFAALTPSSDKSTLLPATQTVTQSCDGTSDGGKVTATVKDANGNPVGGATVVFTIDNQPPQSATTGSDGMASVTVTSNNRQQSTWTVDVHAAVQGAELPGSPAHVVFQLAPGCVPAPAAINVAMSDKAQQGTPLKVVLTLTDADSKPLVGADLSKLTLTPSSTDVTVSPVTDNGDGTYSFTLDSTVVGSYTLGVAYGGDSYSTSIPFSFVAEPIVQPAPVEGTLTVVQATDGSGSLTAVAQITKYPSGTSLTDLPVKFSVTGDASLGAGLTSTSVVPDSQGRASVELSVPAYTGTKLTFDVSASVTVNGVEIPMGGSPMTVTIESPSDGPTNEPTNEPTTPTNPPTAPVAPTTTPAATPPVGPTAPATPPVAPTTAPVAPTTAPVAPTTAPVAPTTAPVAPTTAPVAPTTPAATGPIGPIGPTAPTTPAATGPAGPTAPPTTPGTPTAPATTPGTPVVLNTPVITTADDQVIAGTGTAGTVITVKDAQGAVLGSPVVNADGTWRMTTPEGLATGTVISATAADGTGTASSPAQATVTKSPSGGQTTIVESPIQVSGKVTGDFDAGTTVTITYSTATGQGTTQVNVAADGSWTATLPADALPSPVTAVAKDSTGKVLASGVIQVTQSPDTTITESPTTTNTPSQTTTSAPTQTTTGAPTQAQPTSGTTTSHSPINVNGKVSGTFDPGTTVTITYPTATGQGSVQVNVAADGTWSATLPAEAVPGSMTAVVKDSAGNVLASNVIQVAPAQTITITATPTATSTHTPAPSQIKVSGHVSGVVDPGTTVTITYPTATGAGTTVVSVASDGSYSVTLPADAVPGALTVVEKDASGKVLASSVVQVNPSGDVTVTPTPPSGATTTPAAVQTTAQPSSGTTTPAAGPTTIYPTPVTTTTPAAVQTTVHPPSVVTTTPASVQTTVHPPSTTPSTPAMAPAPVQTTPQPSAGTEAQTPVTATIEMSSTTLSPGQNLVVTGHHWVPGEQVTITVHSDPIQFPPVTVNPDGSLPSMTVTVPPTLEAGTHTLTAVGTQSGTVTMTFQVLAAGDVPAGSVPGASGSGQGALASTGGQAAVAPGLGWLMGAALVATGLAVAVVRRRRA